MSSITVVAEGQDLNELQNYEPMFAEGDYGQVIAFTATAPPEIALANIQEDLLNQGVVLTGPIVYSPELGAVVVSFQKAMPALAAVGVGLGALLAIGAAVMAWSLIQSMGGSGSPAVGIWIALGLLGLVLFFKSQEGRSIVKTTVEAGAYVGKAAVHRWSNAPYVSPDLKFEYEHREKRPAQTPESTPGSTYIPQRPAPGGLSGGRGFQPRPSDDITGEDSP